jgi:hypothetical protein
MFHTKESIYKDIFVSNVQENMSLINDITERIFNIFVDKVVVYFKLIHKEAIDLTKKDKKMELLEMQNLLNIKHKVKDDAFTIYNASILSEGYNWIIDDLTMLKVSYQEHHGKEINVTYTIHDIIENWLIESARELYKKVEIFHHSNKKNLDNNLKSILLTCFMSNLSTFFSPSVDDDSEENENTNDEYDTCYQDIPNDEDKSLYNIPEEDKICQTTKKDNYHNNETRLSNDNVDEESVDNNEKTDNDDVVSMTSETTVSSSSDVDDDENCSVSDSNFPPLKV